MDELNKAIKLLEANGYVVSGPNVLNEMAMTAIGLSVGEEITISEILCICVGTKGNRTMFITEINPFKQGDIIEIKEKNYKIIDTYGMNERIRREYRDVLERSDSQISYKSNKALDYLIVDNKPVETAKKLARR